MAQMPDPESPARGEMPTASNSDAAAWLAWALRGCARSAVFLFRLAGSVDAAMGETLQARVLKTQSKSQSLSLIGSGGILIAAFAPFLNVPVVGAVTYFNGDSKRAVMGGLLCVVLGIAARMFALVEKYLWLYPIGFSTVLIAIGPLLSWKWYQTHVRT